MTKAAVKKLTPWQARLVLSALQIAPEALEKTKQFSKNELAAYRLAQSLKAEGRYADALQVLAKRNLIERLQEMTESVLSLGNKYVVDNFLDQFGVEGENAETVKRITSAKKNPRTAWVVSYRGKNVRFPWEPNTTLDTIFEKEVKPFLLQLRARGIDLDDVVVVDAVDLEEQDQK